jgi:hypothetical protein
MSLPEYLQNKFQILIGINYLLGRPATEVGLEFRMTNYCPSGS